MAREISNSDDVIDSRDVIARIEELQADRDDCAGGWSADDELLADKPEALASWEADFGDELKSLESLAAEADGCADWEYGETLIRDSYFTDYAQQLAEEGGAIKGIEGWPLNCIDWNRAARELQHDYMTVDFDGVTYWIRP